MILQQNYRKVAEYTQKAFKIFTRRYVANTLLQMLQKKNNPKYTSQQQYLLEQSALDGIDQSNSKSNGLHDSIVQKSQGQFGLKSFKSLSYIKQPSQIILIQILKYGDIIHIQILNSQSNEQKPQKLRIISQFDQIKYKKLTDLQGNYIDTKQAWQIICPYDNTQKGNLRDGDLFCLKSVGRQRFWILSKAINMAQYFGNQVRLTNQITQDCFMSIKSTNPNENHIVTYQPIGIMINSMYLKARAFDIMAGSEGSVFYFTKVHKRKQQIFPQFVRIRNLHLNRFISSEEIQMAKKMNKKTYSNVIIQDQNGLPIKQNQLLFATLDMDKQSSAQLAFQELNQQSSKQIWNFNNLNNNQQSLIQVNLLNDINLIHFCSNRGLAIKNDTRFKITSNKSEFVKLQTKDANKIQLFQNYSYQSDYCYNKQQNYSDLQHCQQQDYSNKQNYCYKQNRNEIKQPDLKQTNLKPKQKQWWKNFHLDNNFDRKQQIIQLVHNEQNLIITNYKQNPNEYYLTLQQTKLASKGQQTQYFGFQIIKVSQKQNIFLIDLLEIQNVLKVNYLFLQKLGFTFDQRNQSLKFSVEQIKINKIQITKVKLSIKKILYKILNYLKNYQSLGFSQLKIQNIIKEVKIFEIFICILKILHLKMGKKNKNLQNNKAMTQKQINNNKVQNQIVQTPFSFCTQLFQSLQIEIFDLIYQLTKNNPNCSNTIIQQAGFFNKLLGFYSNQIGKILQQAIKNLSLLTIKSSNSQNSQIFQWAKLIEPLTQENVLIQKTYIDIISQVVIDPNDHGIISYQNKCKQLLFNQRNKKKLMPKFGLENKTPTITLEYNSSLAQFFQQNPILNQVQTSSSHNACFFIQDLYGQQEDLFKPCYTQKTFNYIQYITSILNLFRNLSKDRNKKLVKILQDYGLNRAHFNCVLRSNKMGPKLKMFYFLLYSALFIDQDPFLSFQRRQTKCHLWQKICQYKLDSKTALIFRQYTDLSSAIDKFKQFDQNVVHFLQKYIQQSKVNLNIIQAEQADHLPSRGLKRTIKKGQNENKSNKYQKRISKGSSISCQSNEHIPLIITSQLLSRILSILQQFLLTLKVLYQSTNFGYFNLKYIKRYISFVIEHYDAVDKYYQEIQSKQLQLKHNMIETYDKIKEIREKTLQQIIKLISLNQEVWVGVTCIALLKDFQQTYHLNRNDYSNFHLMRHFQKHINFQLSIPSEESNRYNINLSKKKTTSKHIFVDGSNLQSLDQKSNFQFDKRIQLFLLKLVLSLKALSHRPSYFNLISLLQLRQSRADKIFNQLSSYLILNGKKQQNIYRDYSGRVTGKILNVIKIQQLVSKIKGTQYQNLDVTQEEKRKKQKIVELNNLLNKIRREITQMKMEDLALLKSFQGIIEKLNIDTILLELLYLSQRAGYAQIISNIYKFYIEFTWNNKKNKLKLSKNCNIFIKNMKVQKCGILVGQLFLTLSLQQKKQNIQLLFQQYQLSIVTSDNQRKQNCLQTFYQIILLQRQKELLANIKCQLIYQMSMINDYRNLLNIPIALAHQYVNLICLLTQRFTVFKQHIKQLYTKTQLRQLIVSKATYQQKMVFLKLFYYLHLRQNHIQVYQVQYLFNNFVIPEIKHLPAVCQYLAHENLDYKHPIKGFNNTQVQDNRYQEKKPTISNKDDLIFLKKNFEQLILEDKSSIQPSLQEQYWHFLYSEQNQSQMSLINFILLLIQKKQLANQSQKTKYNQMQGIITYNFEDSFMEYLKKLCEFLRRVFRTNTNIYHRKIMNKLQQILILLGQKHRLTSQNIPTIPSQPNKQKIKQFFTDFSTLLVQQNISYDKVLKCMNIKNNEIFKIRINNKEQKMILQAQFFLFVQKISQQIKNQKKFKEKITDLKVMEFFHAFSCLNRRKINILRFLHKLYQLIQLNKNKQLNQINQFNLNADKQYNNGDKQYNNGEKQYNNHDKSYNNHDKQYNSGDKQYNSGDKQYNLREQINLQSFSANNNLQDAKQLVQQNFKVYIQHYKKSQLHRSTNSYIIKKCLLDVQKLYIKQKIEMNQQVQTTIDHYCQNSSQNLFDKSYEINQKNQKYSLQRPYFQFFQEKQLEQYKKKYLHTWFKTSAQHNRNKEEFIRTNLVSNHQSTSTNSSQILQSEDQVMFSFKSIFQIHNKFFKQSQTFSRIILWLLRQANCSGNIFIEQSVQNLRKYLMSNIFLDKNVQNLQFLKIMYSILINLHKTQTSSLYIQLNNKNTYQNLDNLCDTVISTCLKYLHFNLNKILTFNTICFDFLSNKKITRQSKFPLQNIITCLQMLDYALRNQIFQVRKYPQVQFFFQKIISFWAMMNFHYNDHTWLTIIQSITNIYDTYINHSLYIEQRLVSNKNYIKKFHNLLTNCCQKRIYTTNVRGLTQIKLLNTLMKFHFSSYRENQINIISELLNQLNFQTLSKGIKKLFRDFVQPKLYNYENQIFCQQIAAQDSKCTDEVCNQNKITQNDQNIIEVFFNLMIIIRLTILFKDKGYFKKLISTPNLSILNSFKLCFYSTDGNKQKIQYDINCKTDNKTQQRFVEFYKKNIGLIKFKSKQLSIVSINFEIPNLSKYCNDSLKKRLLKHLINKEYNVQIHEKIQIFSLFFEQQLKSLQSSTKTLIIPLIIQYRSLIQFIITCLLQINLLMLLVQPSLIKSMIYFPFTTVFVFFKIIFLIQQYKNTKNLLTYLMRSKRMVLKQKIILISKENLAFSSILVLIYLLAYLRPQIYPIIAILELLFISFCKKLILILFKAFFNRIIFIVYSFGVIALYYQIVMKNEDQNNQVYYILNGFIDFYTFAIANFKVTSQNTYQVSRKYPLSFVLYTVLIAIFIFTTIDFFIQQLKMQKQNEKLTSRTCLICLEKEQNFKQKGQTFTQHIKYQHNLWNYLYYFIYLRNKINNQKHKNLKGIQKYVIKSIKNLNFDFMKIQKNYHNNKLSL